MSNYFFPLGTAILTSVWDSTYSLAEILSLMDNLADENNQ